MSIESIQIWSTLGLSMSLYLKKKLNCLYPKVYSCFKRLKLLPNKQSYISHDLLNLFILFSHKFRGPSINFCYLLTVLKSSYLF